MTRVLYLIRGRTCSGPTLRRLAGVGGAHRYYVQSWRQGTASITPLAHRVALPIETDARLEEALLATGDLPNWQADLAATFAHSDLVFAGGESGREATERVVATFNEVVQHEARITAVVTHGRLLTLLLCRFDRRYGYASLMRRGYPDVFCTVVTQRGVRIEQIGTATSTSLQASLLPLHR